MSEVRKSCGCVGQHKEDCVVLTRARERVDYHIGDIISDTDHSVTKAQLFGDYGIKTSELMSGDEVSIAGWIIDTKEEGPFRVEQKQKLGIPEWPLTATIILGLRTDGSLLIDLSPESHEDAQLVAANVSHSKTATRVTLTLEISKLPPSETQPEQSE